MKRNIALNNLNNIETYKIAIGKTNYIKKFNIYDESNCDSFIFNKVKNLKQVIETQIVSLDYFLKNKEIPSLIRMDVEGFEYEIIIGMKETLKNKNLILFIEIHPTLMKPFQTRYVFETLRENGFKIIKATRRFIYTETELMKKKEYDYSHYTIDDFLNDEDIIMGYRNNYEIFFINNKQVQDDIN